MFRIGHTLGILLVTAVMTVWAPIKAIFEVWHGGVLLLWDAWR